jgi:hypothetical protein
VEMFPHERSLVKRMAEKKKPFALIGVNSDPNLEDAKKKNEIQEITWRSFWCGKDSIEGEIPSMWRVKGWPTLFIIDHKGVIRHKYIGNPGDAVLDKNIEDLVKEAEKDLKTASQ